LEGDHLKKATNEKGAALVATLLLMVVGVILVTGMVALSQSESRQTIDQTKNMKAYYIARAGADTMIHRLLTIDKEYWNDFTTTLTTDATNFGDGSFVVSVERTNDEFAVVSTGTYQNAEEEVKAVLKYNPNTKMQYVIFTKDPMMDIAPGELNDDIGSGGIIKFKNDSYDTEFRPYANENVIFNPEISEVDLSDVESNLTEADPLAPLLEVSSIFSAGVDDHDLPSLTIDTSNADFEKQEDEVTHEVSMVYDDTSPTDPWMVVWLSGTSSLSDIQITGNNNLMLIVDDSFEINGNVTLSGSGNVEIHVIDDSTGEPADDYDLVLSSPHMSIGSSADSDRIRVYLADNSHMKLDVNGGFYGYIIGPEAKVDIKNPHTLLYGGLYCKTVDIDANVEIYSATPNDDNPIRLESIQFAYWEEE
jgi:hypothetical protein